MLDALGLLAAPRSETSGPSTTSQQAQEDKYKGPRILVFDVIETMLNVNSLQPQFQKAFGDGTVLRDWFSTMLHYSVVVTLADAYSDFGSIAKAALQMVAKSRNATVSSEDQNAILAHIGNVAHHLPQTDAAQFLAWVTGRPRRPPI